jgi:hypothetical protein
VGQVKNHAALKLQIKDLLRLKKEELDSRFSNNIGNFLKIQQLLIQHKVLLMSHYF